MGKTFVNELGVKYICELEKSSAHIDGIGTVPVYGVRIFKEGCEYSSNEYDCSYVKDVSTRKSIAEEFVELAVKHKLSPVHLSDAVYNFICQ